MERRESFLESKSMEFSVRIYYFYKNLNSVGEFAIANQILRSGTSVGANISEAYFAESRSDFVHKLSIARKEGNETLYWLRLCRNVSLVGPESFDDLGARCEELMRLLTATIKKIRANEGSQS